MVTRTQCIRTFGARTSLFSNSSALLSCSFSRTESDVPANFTAAGRASTGPCSCSSSSCVSHGAPTRSCSDLSSYKDSSHPQRRWGSVAALSESSEWLQITPRQKLNVNTHQDDAYEGSGDYDRLRECAKQELEAIQKYRKEKRQAGANGQLRLVAELAEEIKKHRQRRQLFDEQASHLIFASKQILDSQVDFHGLTAEEATTHAKRAIKEACERGVAQLRLVVGKGLHSSGPPVLKPCMLKLMKKLKIPVEVDPSNEGILVVQLIPTSSASPPVVWDQTPLQGFLSQTGQLVPSPILIPEVYASPPELDQLTDDSSREPVQDCQVNPTPLVPIGDEELSELPQVRTLWPCEEIFSLTDLFP
ncbi:hypothetical protein AGABI1DRAFT_47634 [Agaricus bisporus var. burnettii JB137-S8]|uniref:Smr domain-containing protein n=1 Tax=Agaricus bisporus var. burnettii (strain JB137-S8 / ATCC MYA-4627 / FGSC 10392) TaxID=597362 RepID=K5VK11_AGABU|nr:uncharacterized protein AGABI1DRAFT_47634 [Agaricus bisporus var. burnettii JB137-S8]EKM74669.1 hypothetical protein AGABI1DRAFT_47634 [Agaricus bisporus var. burnettii JB137-S8]